MLKNERQPFCWLIVFFCLIFNMEMYAQATWRIKNRFQFGFEYDSNFRESRLDEKSEPSFRILFNTRGERTTPHSSLGYNCSIGYQAYHPEVKEDKLINEYSLNIQWKLKNWLQAGVEAWTRIKFFVYNDIDYSLITPKLFIKFDLPLNADLLFHYSPQFLDYWSSSYFDYDGQEFGITVCKKFTRRFLLEFSASDIKLNFSRKAIDRPLSGQFVLVLDENQQDDIRRYSFKLQYFKYIYATLGYFYEHDGSNSYGSTYHNQWFMFSLSKKLPREMLLRMYAMYQKKVYDETLSDVIPQELDTEREDNNFLILDLSKTIAAGYDLFFRLAFYNNESPYRSYYYKKQTFNLGFDFRF